MGADALRDALTAQGAEVLSIPPRAALPDATVGQLVVAYADDRIDQANARVCEHLHTTRPVAVGVAPAGLLLEMAGPRWVLVGGPPTEWGNLPAAQRRTVEATCVLEGWAPDTERAAAMLDDGMVGVAPALPEGAAVPGAMAVGPSTPCWLIRDDATGAQAVSPVLHGGQDVLWRGVVNPASLRAARVLAESLGPALAAALRVTGPLDACAHAAEALGMADDGFGRTDALSLLLMRDLLPALAQRAPRGVHAATTLLPGPGFGMSLLVGAARATLAGMPQATGSTVLTAVAGDRSGAAIQIAGLPGRWFTAPSPALVDGGGRGLVFAGDGAIPLLLGLPSLGSGADDQGVTLAASRRFTTAAHPAGTPLAIDVRACLDAAHPVCIPAHAVPVTRDAAATVRPLRAPLDAMSAALGSLLYDLDRRGPAPPGD